MTQTNPSRPMPWSFLLAVLIGFPAVSTLLSLLLLRQEAFALHGIAFRPAFWSLVMAWYCVQIALLGRVLRHVGWHWRDIGFGFGRVGTTRFVLGYLVFAVGVLCFVEWALAGVTPGSERWQRLSDLSNLTPRTTVKRLVFVGMGLAAGVCEELVYRGFAIAGLRSRGSGAWLAVPLAAIPFVFQHGLKSAEQFGWFFCWGLVFGILFVLTKRLYVTIVLHWLVILSAMPAALQVLQ